MTANDIFKRALTLLGYVNGNGEISGYDELKKRCIATVNIIYADLFYALGREGFKMLDNSLENVELPERVLNDVMPYGVAMLISQSENDADSQQLYASIYNKKRASVRAAKSVEDVLPKGSDY